MAAYFTYRCPAGRQWVERVGLPRSSRRSMRPVWLQCWKRDREAGGCTEITRVSPTVGREMLKRCNRG